MIVCFQLDIKLPCLCIYHSTQLYGGLYTTLKTFFLQTLMILDFLRRVCPSERFLDPPPEPLPLLSILYMTKLVFFEYYLGLG